jgi:hypothetical protein
MSESAYTVIRMDHATGAVTRGIAGAEDVARAVRTARYRGHAFVWDCTRGRTLTIDSPQGRLVYRQSELAVTVPTGDVL